MILWASANRDESVFPEAERVVLDRSPNGHLAFGAGVHRCVGATLARTELRIVLEEFLKRVPDYEVVEEGVVRSQSAGTIYGRVHIPVRFTPSPRPASASQLT
jgi:cytochrome P450